MFLLVVVASSAALVQRWDYSVLPSDVNIGGMATIFLGVLYKDSSFFNDENGME